MPILVVNEATMVRSDATTRWRSHEVVHLCRVNDRVMGS